MSSRGLTCCAKMHDLRSYDAGSGCLRKLRPVNQPAATSN